MKPVYTPCAEHGKRACDRCPPCTCHHCTCPDCRNSQCVQHGFGAPFEPVVYVHAREEELANAINAARERLDRETPDAEGALDLLYAAVHEWNERDYEARRRGRDPRAATARTPPKPPCSSPPRPPAT